MKTKIMSMRQKAPKERDMSTIPRGSETLHPVKPNLRFLIGVKGVWNIRLYYFNTRGKGGQDNKRQSHFDPALAL
jgi:hypothetical protein